MSELARSLTDAAAEALRAARFVDWDDDTMPTFHQPGDVKGISDGRIDVWTSPDVAARAVLAAVLEALAAHCDPVPDGEGTRQVLLANTEFRRLAAEVGEVTP